MMVMLHYSYVYKLLLLNYEIHYKVLQGFGLVMLDTFLFFGIPKLMKVYLEMCNLSMGFLYYG